MFYIKNYSFNKKSVQISALNFYLIVICCENVLKKQKLALNWDLKTV